MTDLFDIDWGFGTLEAPAPAGQPEAQSEPKGRKTRSHLKAKVYETSDKFEYRRAFSEIQLLDTKIMAGTGDKFAFVIESSANINTNPRTENTVVTIDEGLYRFHKDYFDGIVSIEK